MTLDLDALETKWGLGRLLDSEFIALIKAVRERDAAYAYAKNLCEIMVAKRFPENLQWRVHPDLIDVLTQIDNACAQDPNDLATAHAHLRQAVEALERISLLTPAAANAATARDQHLTVKAIADTAIDDITAALGDKPTAPASTEEGR